MVNKPLAVIPTARIDDWWQLRHQQKLDEVAAKKEQAEWVFLGDSITHAWEVEGEQTWQQYFAPFNAMNLGYAGDRTEHLLWRIKNGELDYLSPKWVVILIGTNNAGHRHDSPENIATGIKVILQEVTERLPNSKILLMAIFPRSRDLSKRMRKKVNETNKLIQHFANGQQIHWLNINHKFLTSHGILLESIMPDLLHPNEAQYPVWANALLAYIQAH